MIKDECVRPKGCICEPCSDISTNCRDMRSGFGYKLLSAIAGKNIKNGIWVLTC